MGDIEKLEELFKNGFILEHEYQSRKSDLKALPTQTSSQKPLEFDEVAANIHKYAQQGNDSEKLVENIKKLRMMLSKEKDPPIFETLTAGLMPILVKVLNDDSKPNGQYEALWCLTNILSGQSDATRLVAKSGAVPILIRLIGSPHARIFEKVVWALGNIAGESTQLRDFLLSQGAMQILVDNITKLQENSQKQGLVVLYRTAIWTLSNLCRGKPAPPFSMISCAIPLLVKFLYAEDNEILMETCWALSYISDGANDQIQVLMEAGIARRIVELIMHPESAVITPALRTAGNFCTGTDLQTQVVINVGLLPVLLVQLNSKRKSIRKEACWTLSNITAGNTEQIQMVIDNNIFPALLKIVKEADFDLKKEAIWALSNATNGAQLEQMEYLFSLGAVDAFIEVLRMQDARLVDCAVESLQNMYNAGAQKASQQGSSQNPLKDIYCQKGIPQILKNMKKNENATSLLATIFCD